MPLVFLGHVVKLVLPHLLGEECIYQNDGLNYSHPSKAGRAQDAPEEVERQGDLYWAGPCCVEVVYELLDLVSVDLDEIERLAGRQIGPLAAGQLQRLGVDGRSEGSLEPHADQPEVGGELVADHLEHHCNRQH